MVKEVDARTRENGIEFTLHLGTMSPLRHTLHANNRKYREYRKLRGNNDNNLFEVEVAAAGCTTRKADEHLAVHAFHAVLSPTTMLLRIHKELARERAKEGRKKRGASLFREGGVLLS